MSEPRDPLATDDAPPALARVPAAFAPGAVIADRYRIEARLGSGGGGTVWRCTDQKLDAVVALKIVSSDGDLERWRREVAMARRIADRNVCRVHDLGETAELRFVTMELVEGTSLRSRIHPELPAAEARTLFAQIVSGVTAIHAAGVVHRDLKPDNIVVANDGRVVIVDFGLAREPVPMRQGEAFAPPGAVTKVINAVGPTTPAAEGTVTSVGTVVGTPRYMSPEQAAGDTVDARTDVWALGLIAHELLTGVLPEADANGRRIAETVDAKWPSATPILRRCLAMVPDERYSDARALQAALATRTRRWPWLAGAALAAATAIVVGIVAFGGSSDVTPAPAPTPPPGPVAVVPYRMLQLTTTGADDWPAEAPMSVAISPDGKRFAYTTGGAKLYVRDVAGGAKVAWALPKLVRLQTVTAVGWFSDRSLGIAGTTFDGHHLYRIREDGRSEHLYSSRVHFHAAITSIGDRVAIAIDDQALYMLAPGTATPEQIRPIGKGEQVMALAWSPDGTKLAVGRLPARNGEEAVIHTMQASGKQVVEVWRGHSLAIVDPLLAWVAADRLAFSYQDPDTRVTSLLAIDTTTRDFTVREQFPDDYLGMGGAANGAVLLLRGTAGYAVQVRSKYGHSRWRAHPSTTQGSGVAGFTTDGRLVFLEGPPAKAQIVAATPSTKTSEPWTTAPWPNTVAGVDVADSVIGEALVVHRVDPADARHVLVEQVSPDGARVQLARIDNEGIANPVRCAGDRATPCVLEQLDGDTHVTWTELDVDKRTLGRPIHRRPVRDRHMRGVALSHDGSTLAIVDGGNEVTLVDRMTGEVATKLPTAEPGAMLQSVGFVENGDLWVTAVTLQGRPFALARFHPGEKRYTLANVSSDPLRWFWRPSSRSSGDDVQVGVTVRDFHLEIWRADGI